LDLISGGLITAVDGYLRPESLGRLQNFDQQRVGLAPMHGDSTSGTGIGIEGGPYLIISCAMAVTNLIIQKPVYFLIVLKGGENLGRDIIAQFLR